MTESIFHRWSCDLKDTADFFTDRSLKYDSGHEAAHWGSQLSQTKRFEVLTENLENLSDSSLLDVGCGVGDLLDYLIQKGKKPRKYTGVDISKGMLDRAERRFEGQEGVQFHLGLLDELPLGPHDYVVSSGIFYRLKEDAYAFMEKTVALLFDLTSVCLGFNTLTTLEPRNWAGEFRADPSKVLAFCGTLTNKLIFRHDYHPGDGTFLLFKDIS